MLSNTQEYRDAHKHCPSCSGTDIESTTVGVIGDKDTNRAYCHGCDWEGIVHDLTPEPPPYKKRVSYQFEIRNEFFEIEEGDTFLEISECRKNGQEDCHMFGIVKETPQGYEWDGGRQSFEDYGYRSLPNLILSYVNKHGKPSSKVS